ncbi:methyl-accepting chemotaxis protein [Tabrizicola sp.]|uniref:methyl-accepting chemotaxis protein n=1 Tax=Tabrizicola sp. TaxID=2005166 RepID=UPI0035AE19CF
MPRMDLNSLKLTRKLPALMLAVSAIAVLLVAGAAYIRAEIALSDAANAWIEEAAIGPAATLDAVMGDLVAHVDGLSHNRGLAAGVVDLSRAIGIEPGGLAALHDRYVRDIPPPSGESAGPPDPGSAFDLLHADIQAELSAWAAAMDYHDVYLIDREGTVVFSTAKGADFATNLRTGPWNGTGLSRVFDRLSLLDTPGTPVFEDFSPYPPAGGAPGAFIGRHLVDRKGQVLGVVAIQVSIDHLNAALNGKDAGGSPLRSYLVGRDGILRSDLPATPADEVLSARAPSGVIALLSSTRPTIAETTGADGQPIVAAVHPLSVPGAAWAVVTEIDRAVLFRPITVMTWWFVGIGLVVLAGTSIIAGLASHSIVRPLQRLVADMGRVARREAAGQIGHTGRGDEIGEIARALRDMDRTLAEAEQEARKAEADRLALLERQRAAERAEETRRQEAERAEQDRDAAFRAEQDRARAEHEAAQDSQRQAQQTVVDHLARSLRRMAEGDLDVTIDEFFSESYKTLRMDFNDAVRALRKIVAEISRSSGRINADVQAIRFATEDLAQRTEKSAAAINQTSGTMTEMTGLVGDTTSSIQTVRDLTREAARQATAGMEIITRSEAAMMRIQTSSEAITRIIAVIDDIAFQTNLLALNAGVEAARAGDSGRGFAVVASEVRALAQRASESAREIGQLITDSGQHVRDGVVAMRESGGVVESITRSVSAISHSVAGIAGSAAQQENGIRDVNASLRDLDGATQRNAAMFEETLAATVSLSQSIEELNQLVSRFKGWQEDQADDARDPRLRAAS